MFTNVQFSLSATLAYGLPDLTAGAGLHGDPSVLAWVVPSDLTQSLGLLLGPGTLPSAGLKPIPWSNTISKLSTIGGIQKELNQVIPDPAYQG